MHDRLQASILDAGEPATSTLGDFFVKQLLLSLLAALTLCSASLTHGGFNFGCGSSREHAVWGLLQYGIQAVIAPSFAEIFHSNAMGNRLLLVPRPTEVVEELMTLSETPNAPEVNIDVGAGTVRWADHASAVRDFGPPPPDVPRRRGRDR